MKQTILCVLVAMLLSVLVPVLWYLREQRKDLEALQHKLLYVERQAAYGYSWAIDVSVAAIKDGAVKRVRPVAVMGTNELGWLTVTVPDNLSETP